MPTYAFQAMNSSGQEVKDEVEAAIKEEAIARSAAKGYFPTKIREKAAKKKVAKKGAGAAGPANAKDADLHRRRAAKAVGRLHPPAFHPSGRRAAHPALACRFSKQQQKPGLAQGDHRRRGR